MRRETSLPHKHVDAFQLLDLGGARHRQDSLEKCRVVGQFVDRSYVICIVVKVEQHNEHNTMITFTS